MTLPNPTQPSVTSIECSECAAPLRITRQPLCGEIVRCTECHAELEVVNLEPLRVELAPLVQEDWGE